MSPQLAVISVGDDNPHGHPSEEVMDRLKKKLGSENIYQTYDAKTEEHYSFEFITDGERLWVKVER